MDTKELMAYGNNLIGFLKEEKDIIALNHFLRQSKALQFQCGKDLNDARKTIQDCQEKIKVNQLSVSAGELESVTDAELDLLQKELEEKHQLEQMLRGALRQVFGVLVSVEEQRNIIRKLEQDDLRAQMKLSMYASITKMIPCFDDDQFKISGHIVEGNKKLVEKFNFDRAKLTSFETCGSLWRMTSS